MNNQGSLTKKYPWVTAAIIHQFNLSNSKLMKATSKPSNQHWNLLTSVIAQLKANSHLSTHTIHSTRNTKIRILKCLKSSSSSLRQKITITSRPNKRIQNANCSKNKLGFWKLNWWHSKRMQSIRMNLKSWDRHLPKKGRRTYRSKKVMRGAVLKWRSNLKR